MQRNAARRKWPGEAFAIVRRDKKRERDGDLQTERSGLIKPLV